MRPKSDAVKKLEACGDWRTDALDDTSGVLSVNVRFYVNACYYLVPNISYEICVTISSAKNFKISDDQMRLNRSVVFLIFFIVVQARSVPRFSLRRISRSRMTERGLHEVPFSSSFSLWCMPSGICTCSRDQTTSTGTAIYMCAFVLDRIWSPGKHCRRVRAVERCVAHLCWFEANVGPVTVF